MKKSQEISSRQQKVAGLIHQSLIAVLQRGRQVDKRLLDNKITITYVTVSADLKIASCYFIPFGYAAISNEELIEALNASKYSIRQQVTEKVNLKYSPELRFFYDYGFEKASEVEQALSRLKSEGNIEENN